MTFDGRSWTYGELDEASNRLAHLLTGVGCRPGVRVWRCCSPRSAEAIVAILAVLKTGAAYLPIDPALPAARIEFMVDDAAPIAAITTAGLAELAGRIRPDRHRCRGSPHRHPTRYRVAGAGARRPGSPHLHLGHHRGAQGGGHHPPQRHPTAGVTGRRLAAGGGVDAVSLVGLRRLGVGDLGCAAASVGGWWWCPSRWPAHRRTSTPYWSPNRSAS